ncbi:hypothetical protein GUJ93_ZPchr0006g42320 [Zizania palustris]|uniref:Uncharacterized protein n=1 Tax=Zizania palustris TaxID=103762 RepID=A0A8J5SWW1_ZIZPA|nr:hypothetical protein GUJ93_ZPchr0006g42320 [Zizania palustris]
MGLQEVKKKLNLHGVQVEEGHGDVSGEKKAVWIALPLPLPLKPVKVSRRRHGGSADAEDNEEEEEVTTPRGEGCRIPAEATTCPPAPKKPRTAAVSIVASRRCNCDDGDVLEFFRVPADLEAVFVNRVAKAN